jgi:hypothetical protein
MLNHLA